MKSEWIVFDDELPPHDQDVLMINSVGTMRVGYISDCIEYTRLKFGSESRAMEHWKFKVTHWMPLPELPK